MKKGCAHCSVALERGVLSSAEALHSDVVLSAAVDF